MFFPILKPYLHLHLMIIHCSFGIKSDLQNYLTPCRLHPPPPLVDDAFALSTTRGGTPLCPSSGGGAAFLYRVVTAQRGMLMADLQLEPQRVACHNCVHPLLSQASFTLSAPGFQPFQGPKRSLGLGAAGTPEAGKKAPDLIIPSAARRP
jgi:hypothetical protein